MASYHIENTRIGTGETANIADDNAIPIYEYFHFPKNWSKGFDFNFFDLNKDVTISILHGRVSTDAQLSLGFGLAGPNWAGAMDVEGNVTDDTLLLDITNDQFVAGMLVGADASLTLNLAFQFERETFEFDWRHPFSSHWTYAWHDLARVNTVFQFDLLTTLVNIAVVGVKIVKALLKLIPGLSKIIKLLPDVTLPAPRSFNSGISDHVSSSSFFTGGLDFPTSLEASFNLIDIAEVLGKTGVEVVQPELIPAIEIETKMETLAKWIKPTVGTGPIFGLNFTTFLRISGINAYWGTEKHKLTDVHTVGAEIEAKLPAEAPQSAPDGLGIEFDHRPAIDFTIGWYVSLTWLKIFSVQPEKRRHPSDFSDAFTVPAGDAYTYEVRNNVGSTSADDIVVTMVEDWIFG